MQELLVKKNFFISFVVFLIVAGTAFAQARSTIDLSNPISTPCGTNFAGFICNIMVGLLYIGPMIAIIALVMGGIIYVYANVFVSSDQRGRYHSIATSLVVGALILAAICGGAGILTSMGTKFIQAPPAASS